MFVVCTPEQSDALHQELIAIEQELFTSLGLHFKVSTSTGSVHSLGQCVEPVHQRSSVTCVLGRVVAMYTHAHVCSSKRQTDPRAGALHKPGTALQSRIM